MESGPVATEKWVPAGAGSRCSTARSPSTTRGWVITDRSTTGKNPVDRVETGWMEPQTRGLTRTLWTKTATLPRLGSRVRIPSSVPTESLVVAGSGLFGFYGRGFSTSSDHVEPVFESPMRKSASPGQDAVLAKMRKSG